MTIHHGDFQHNAASPSLETLKMTCLKKELGVRFRHPLSQEDNHHSQDYFFLGFISWQFQ